MNTRVMGQGGVAGGSGWQEFLSGYPRNGTKGGRGWQEFLSGYPGNGTKGGRGWQEFLSGYPDYGSRGGRGWSRGKAGVNKRELIMTELVTVVNSTSFLQEGLGGCPENVGGRGGERDQKVSTVSLVNS